LGAAGGGAGCATAGAAGGGPEFIQAIKNTNAATTQNATTPPATNIVLREEGSASCGTVLAWAARAGLDAAGPPIGQPQCGHCWARRETILPQSGQGLSRSPAVIEDADGAAGWLRAAEAAAATRSITAEHFGHLPRFPAKWSGA
jgi:hypothetical protein